MSDRALIQTLAFSLSSLVAAADAHIHNLEAAAQAQRGRHQRDLTARADRWRNLAGSARSALAQVPPDLAPQWSAR